MDFELTSEQKEIFDTAIKFAKNEMIPFALEYDEKSKFPHDQFKKAWELGLVNTCIPEEYGGIGFGALDSVVIGEALAYGCMGMNTAFMANDLALLPIVIGGSNDQKEKYLRPFTEEHKIAAFCLTEPGNGSDAAGLQTTLKESGDHYLLSGEKMWITNAGEAHLFVVYCTIDPSLRHKGITAVIVEADQEGIVLGKKEDKMGHRASDTRAVRFENVKISKDNIIGKVGDGWSLAKKTLDHSRPLVASSAVGGAQRALDCAAQYSKERKQFGVEIAKHQAIQFMISNMAIKVECSRLLVQKAAWLLDQGKENTEVADRKSVV